LEAARRLERHFRAYTYNEDVEGGHSIQRLRQFLAARTGYCEQFAATMTLMLRGLGIDARVGVGFLPGARTGSEFVVSTRDAHAWVEVNIPGAGWTAFDPTPGRGPTARIPPEADEAAAGTPPPIPQPTSVPAATPVQQEFPNSIAEPASAGIPRAVLWLMAALAVVACVPTAKRIRRAVRNSGNATTMILGAYAELSDTARDLGWRAAPSETHHEFLTRAIGHEHADAGVVAFLAGRALYGPSGEASRDDATRAWSAVAPVLQALRDRGRWWRRAWAVFDPRTFIPESLRSRVRSLGRVLRPALGR
jgi:hypothetical protein